MPNVKLRNRQGLERTYSDINTVTIPDEDDNPIIFAYEEGKKDITSTNETDVSGYATAQVSDSNLIPGNIKKDVNILGITGTHEGGEGPSEYLKDAAVSFDGNTLTLEKNDGSIISFSPSGGGGGGGTKTYTGTITGDGSTTEFTIEHNLNDKNARILVYDANSRDIGVDIQRIDTNNVKIGFGVAPTSGTIYTVYVSSSSGPIIFIAEIGVTEPNSVIEHILSGDLVFAKSDARPLYLQYSGYSSYISGGISYKYYNFSTAPMLHLFSTGSQLECKICSLKSIGILDNFNWDSVKTKVITVF